MSIDDSCETCISDVYTPDSICKNLNKFGSLTNSDINVYQSYPQMTESDSISNTSHSSDSGSESINSCESMADNNYRTPISTAKTLKGQYRAIATGYYIPRHYRQTLLTADNLTKNSKGSYVSLRRHESGKKTAHDTNSFVYARAMAYQKQMKTFQWINKNGKTCTYQSKGYYPNGKLIPIYKKIEPNESKIRL